MSYNKKKIDLDDGEEEEEKEEEDDEKKVETSSLLNSNIPFLSLPPHWLCHIFTYLSLSEKLTELIHVNRYIHSLLTDGPTSSVAFKGEHVDFSPSIRPLVIGSPWMKGVESVNAKMSGPAWFCLDENPTRSISTNSSDDYSSRNSNGIPINSSDSPFVSPSLTPTSSPPSPHFSPLPPFTSIHSLSIDLATSVQSPIDPTHLSNMFHGFYRWTSLQRLSLHADDEADPLLTASSDTALLRKQDFRQFKILLHLHTLRLDATIHHTQLLQLIVCPSLTSLDLTERSPKISTTIQEQLQLQEEEDVCKVLGQLAREVRAGEGLFHLRMPKLHHSHLSIDPFCKQLVRDYDYDDLMIAKSSPLSSLIIQGKLSFRGIFALSHLKQLNHLELGWGCEIDKDSDTLASLPHTKALTSLVARVVDETPEEDRGEEIYIPTLPPLNHILACKNLHSLTLTLPPHAWTLDHSIALGTLINLHRLSLCGEPTSIDAKVPLSYQLLAPLSNKLVNLSSLHLDWLPVTDDALLVISTFHSLREVSLVNCPYLTSTLFLILIRLADLAKLRIYRCDINMTAIGWRQSQLDLFRLTRTPYIHTSFPSLEVLECHLVHRMSRDVDMNGWKYFLSLLPASQLHSFDFDSDYSTLSHFLQLASFPHLRSLGTPSVDVCIYDSDDTAKAKASFARVEKLYYSKDYTRIHRGKKERWEGEGELSHWNSVEFRNESARDSFFVALKEITLIEGEDIETEEITNESINLYECSIMSKSSSNEELHVEVEIDDSLVEEWETEGGEWLEDDDEWILNEQIVGTAAHSYSSYFDNSASTSYSRDGENNENDEEDDTSDNYDDEHSVGPTPHTIVRRVLKLHSRKHKKDEKAVIKAKAALNGKKSATKLAKNQQAQIQSITSANKSGSPNVSIISTQSLNGPSPINRRNSSRSNKSNAPSTPQSVKRGNSSTSSSNHPNTGNISSSSSIGSSSSSSPQNLKRSNSSTSSTNHPNADTTNSSSSSRTGGVHSNFSALSSPKQGRRGSVNATRWDAETARLVKLASLH